MKRKLLLLLLLLALLALAGAVLGQPNSITLVRSHAGSGGSRLSSGTQALTSSVGPAGGSPLQANGYTLRSGFLPPGERGALVYLPVVLRQ